MNIVSRLNRVRDLGIFLCALVACCIGWISTAIALQTVFDDRRATMILSLGENWSEAIRNWGDFIFFAFSVCLVLLVLHLSSIPRTWQIFSRVILTTILPYLAWTFFFLARAYVDKSPLALLLSMLGHPLWFPAFFFDTLTWWIVLMRKELKRERLGLE